MVSPLALISSAISSQRTAISQPRSIGFGNAASTEVSKTYQEGTVNHNTQPFIAPHAQQNLALGMYFRGSIVGTRLNLLG